MKNLTFLVAKASAEKFPGEEGGGDKKEDRKQQKKTEK